MKLIHIYSILSLIVITFFFSACGKENLDELTIIEDEVETEVILCNLDITILEQPLGSGNLLSVVNNSNTQSFTYSWSSGDDTPGITALMDGTYTVTITETNGCTGEVSYTVSLDPCLGFGVEINEDSPGVLDADVTGGTGPFAYAWSTGENTSSINVTTAGTYSVIVTDAEGCIIETEITIDDPTACDLLVEVAPNQSNDYLIAYTSGGTNPLIFFWSTGETTDQIQIPGSGIFSVTVTDANGCVEVDSYEVQ